MKLNQNKKIITTVILSTTLTFCIWGNTHYNSIDNGCRRIANVNTILSDEVDIGNAAHNFDLLSKIRFEEKEKKRLEEEQRLIAEMSSRSKSKQITLSESERKVVECIVQGEAGGEDYIGKCLVAQCLFNSCEKNNITPSQVRKQLKYSGWNTNVSDETRLAVREVFDNGYQVVAEPIMYFYAPKLCKGKWHETQVFVIEHGCHKFFAQKQK